MVSVVVVVFPLVPVMPTQLAGLSRQANSGSPMISAECAAAAWKKTDPTGMPGEAMVRS